MREIRRSGLLLAVELGEPQKLYRIMELFKQAGILSDWFLFCDTAFRISPPLTISEEEIRGSAALILKCLDELGIGRAAKRKKEGRKPSFFRITPESPAAITRN